MPIVFRTAGTRDEVKTATKPTAAKKPEDKAKRKPPPRPYTIALKSETGASLGFITEIPVVRSKGGLPETYSTWLKRDAAAKKAAKAAEKKKTR